MPKVLSVSFFLGDSVFKDIMVVPIIYLYMWLPLPTSRGALSENAALAVPRLAHISRSGRMTEVIRLALYTEVLGPWDGDCAGGRLLSTDTGLADLLPLGVLNTSALSTVSSYGSTSTCLSSIVTNEDKAKYVCFYFLLANSITAFNIRQYRRFPSIFRVEYEVGNWPSVLLVRIKKSTSYCRVRPSTRLTPASLNLDIFRDLPLIRLTIASLKPECYTTRICSSTRLTTPSVSMTYKTRLTTPVVRYRTISKATVD